MWRLHAAKAIAAYNKLRDLASTKLNLVEQPSKGSVLWTGTGQPDLSGLPADMPGVAQRLSHERHLGVLIGDERPESVAAVKAALMEKMTEKSELIRRLDILEDPQVKLQLLRCCAATRPQFWMRTMAPTLTGEAAAWYDEQLMGALEKISLSTLSTHRRGCASLPSAMGGHAITSWSETRYSAHYASWHACYSNISKTFPAAISITPQQIEDPAACALPFAVGIRESYVHLQSDAAQLTENAHEYPLPFSVPKEPKIPTIPDLSERQPRVHKHIAAVVNGARWLTLFHETTTQHRAGRVELQDLPSRVSSAALGGRRLGSRRMGSRSEERHDQPPQADRAAPRRGCGSAREPRPHPRHDAPTGGER